MFFFYELVIDVVAMLFVLGKRISRIWASGLNGVPASLKVSELESVGTGREEQLRLGTVVSPRYRPARRTKGPIGNGMVKLFKEKPQVYGAWINGVLLVLEH